MSNAADVHAVSLLLTVIAASTEDHLAVTERNYFDFI